MKLRMRVQRWSERIGLPGVIGIGLLLFAAMYFLSASLPARERIRALERELAQAAGSPLPDRPVGDDAQGDLARFYGFFATSNSISESLARVDAALGSSGLAFEAGEYRLAREGGMRLVRYELTVPLRGTYKQVREFVATLLEDMPQVSLDDVAVRRETAAHGQIEARLRLSIYLALP